VREALATSGWLFRAGKLLAQSGRKFVAGGQFDFVLNARVIGGDNASAGRVAEKTDDGRMSTPDDADDPAFGAARARETAKASDFGDHRVAMHCVFNEVARNEEVAIDVRKGDVGNNEAVAVVMQDEAAANFIARGGFVLGNFFGGFGGKGTSLLGGRQLGSPTEEEAAVRKLLDETTFLEFLEHVEEGAAVILSKAERVGEILDGHRVMSKL
jgi:hypothetical protein